MRADSGGPAFLQCGFCPAPLKDHHYLDIGSAVAGSREQHDIEGYIEDHEWYRLPFPKASEPADEVIVFRVLRCPSGKGSVVPLLLAKSVLGDDVFRSTVYELVSEEIEAIWRVVGPWKSCAETWSERQKGSS